MIGSCVKLDLEGIALYLHIRVGLIYYESLTEFGGIAAARNQSVQGRSADRRDPAHGIHG